MRVLFPHEFGLATLLILHDEALVESMVLVVGIGVHFTDVNAVVATVAPNLVPRSAAKRHCFSMLPNCEESIP